MIILQNPHLAKHVCHVSGHWFDWAPSRLSDLIGPQGIPLNSGLGMGSGSVDGRLLFSLTCYHRRGPGRERHTIIARGNLHM